MQIRYHTSKGSVYIHTLSSDRDYWVKEDTKKLQELVREYPSTLLDKTYCFDVGVEREFFTDAKLEQCETMFETEETVVIFMVKRESDRYAIGCSSEVVSIEKVE
ncbi:MAG: hypothetical protein ACYSOU_02680 [Planctomycetota bacterium]